ncbi:MAG: Rho termination factor N-terminal domain-containing protein [Mollicutes bacterium]|nr:Rho termination factor N-terminal domain-containing protein [Mollicutes bacterium]
MDFVSEDDKAKTEKRAQKKEADKTSEVKEEKAEEKVTEDLSALTLSELKDRAKDAGVKGYSAMKKQDLVEALTK